ncbi:schlafen family member 2-like [Psammomys obesus]|uniref:schlafen family member 2-like n=1 Tax=Psammomys obesus TaxID=48139 RepID=UPI002453084E|nr:schlafen family member 2-like [Psammomys obesus]XP_055476610.1 schlafen family member 2-like [Psammomys obesus]
MMAGQVVKDVNRQTFTETCAQHKCPGKALQGRRHSRPGRLKDSKKGFHLGNTASAWKMNVSVDKETDYAELVLSPGEITLGEKNRKLMKNCDLRRSEAKNVSLAVCALLNSGGGVVKAPIKNQNYSFTRDGIGLDLEDALRGILPLIHQHLDFMQDRCYFFIFVKAWTRNNLLQRITTKKTNFYKRKLSFSVELKAPEAVQVLRAVKHSQETSGSRQSSCNEVPNECVDLFNRACLSYEETFCFAESTHAEVKLSPKEKILEILPQNISAFANTDGGYLFIGLDGKKRQIIGFEAEKSDLVHLESEIEKCIQQLPVTHFCEEKENIKYTCRFIEVHRPGAVCSYVCALRVERFCCAVFAAEPESWHVEDSCVKRFTAEEWVKLQMDPTAGFIKRGEKRTLQASTPPRSPCTQFFCDNPDAMRKSAMRKSAQFPVGSGTMICSPAAMCTQRFSQQRRCEQLLQTEWDSLHKGRLLIPESWVLDLGLQEKQEVIISDVLHISQDGLLTLHSFVRGDEELEDDRTVLRELGSKLKGYCKQTALILKQTLVNLGNYPGKIGIVIKITYLGRKAMCLYDSSSQIHYPISYYLTNETVVDLEKALANVCHSCMSQ